LFGKDNAPLSPDQITELTTCSLDGTRNGGGNCWIEKLKNFFRKRDTRIYVAPPNAQTNIPVNNSGFRSGVVAWTLEEKKHVDPVNIATPNIVKINDINGADDVFAFVGEVPLQVQQLQQVQQVQKKQAKVQQVVPELELLLVQIPIPKPAQVLADKVPGQIVYGFKNINNKTENNGTRYNFLAEKKVTGKMQDAINDLLTNHPQSGIVSSQFYLDDMLYIVVKYGANISYGQPYSIPIFTGFKIGKNAITQKNRLKDMAVFNFDFDEKTYAVYDKTAAENSEHVTITKEEGSNQVTLTHNGVGKEIILLLPNTQSGGKQYVTVLGSRRLVRKKGRTNYVNYKGTLIKLSDAKRMEQKK
jgi:hypothetical protein